MATTLRAPRRGVRTLGLLAALATLASCGGSPASAPPSAGTGSAAVDQYGYGPKPDEHVTYQPDVVLVGGGPEAVRAVSPDGLVWTLDAAASGVSELAAGKVMFATSVGVGRVASLESKGGTVDVTLIPVSLTEVVRDGHFVVDQPLDPGALTLADVPTIEGGYEDELSGELTSDVPGGMIGGVTLASARGATAPIRDPGPIAAADEAASEASKKLGSWNLTAYRKGTNLGLRAERNIGDVKAVSGEELKVALDAHLETDGLRVVADIPVVSGEVGTSHFRVFGITGLLMTVEAGAVNGLSDNRKAKVEVPIQLQQRIFIGGFPATLVQKFKFLVQTAFTAKNGTITAQGGWDVDGSIGIDGQTVTLPTMTARDPKLVDSVSGISVGVNGIVVAVSFEFRLMIGLPYAGAGPTAAFITSLGLTNGSALGLVKCKQASITSTVSGGVGLQVFDPVKKALKKLAGYDIPEDTTLVSKDVLQERWVSPDVAACR